MGSFVGPPVNGMVPQAQPLNTLCWYSCFRMLYMWKGLDPDTVWQRLKDGGIDVDAARVNGLLAKDNLKAAKALGMKALGFGQPLSPYDLKEPLKSSPAWCAGRWTNGNSGHVVVVIATNENWVRYYDPWWVGTPEDANDSKDRAWDFFLHGDRKSIPGFDQNFQFFPLIYWKG
jgi:hypothetical protein